MWWTNNKIIKAKLNKPYFIDMLRTNEYSLEQLGKRFGKGRTWARYYVQLLEQRGIVKVVRKRIRWNLNARNKYEVLL